MLWWTDELKTGIEELDNQHKTIFEKANLVFDLEKDSPKENVEEVFVFLMNYANNHFYEEESIMMKHNYANFLDHRKEHNYFIEEIYTIYKDVKINGMDENNITLLKALVIDWLINHISTEDKKFVNVVCK